METEKDIVIIGAGLTGLALAYYLKKAGKNVLLLEQSHRTGGVIDSVTEKGFTYEKGPSHCGIYAGNNTFLHVSSKKGVRIDRLDDPYWKPLYLGARKVLP